MPRLSHLGISGRLLGLALLLAAALVLVALFSHRELKDAIAVTERTAEVRMPQLSDMAALELNVTRVSLQLRHAILSRTPQERAAAFADIQSKRAQIDALLRSYEQRLFTRTGKDNFSGIPPLMAAFWQAGEANIALIESGQKEEAFAYLVDHTIPARNALLAQLKHNVDYQKERITEDISEVRADVEATLAVLLVAFAAIVVGQIASAWLVGRMLKRRVAYACAVAQRVREGDLSGPTDHTSHDEFRPLLADLAGMQQSLSSVVRNVRLSAEGVASASTQIALGNQDLSARTEHQASALQQTASTMNEVGTAVRHNADHAQEASTLAQSASQVAQQGGAVVSQVVDTMQGISQASRKIADIIGVIDGIAFQTNILALNAAVEAARAGEQGRGFAVVAGEVRLLAQRSAEAAREIKTLISASTEQVAQGASLVEQAGSTMQDIVQAIERVSLIVSDISAASREQSEGVSQVGTAIEQMDQSTQQNAALVEESAAAAESLRQQATELVQAVAVFKV